MAEAESTELREITGKLRRLRDRLAEAAGALEGVEAAAAGVVRQAVFQAQGQVWGVAAELIGTVARLERLGAADAAGAAGPARSPRAAAVLRGVIECVIADRLDPAIQALVELHQPPDDEESPEELCDD
jgi:hypothetical protein